MLSRLRQVLLSRQDQAVESLPGESIQLAVAALLVEMARADFEQTPAQQQASCRLLADYFQLDDDGVQALVREAEAAVDRSVSLREFTAPLHRSLAEADKQRIIAMLWHVALEDSYLDRHEEHLVSKLAELLYVPRGDVLRLRHRVQAELAEEALSRQKTP